MIPPRRFWLQRSHAEVAGGEFLINTTTTGSQYHSSVTALADGRFVVTWVDGSEGAETGGDDADGTAIRGQILGSAGQALGDEFLVNTTTTGTQYDSSVAVLEDGGFVVTWVDSQTVVNDMGFTHQVLTVRSRVFDASGTPVGAESTVHEISSTDQTHPSVTGLDGGGFVVIWKQNSLDLNGAPSSVTVLYAKIFDGNGAAVSDDFGIQQVSFENVFSSIANFKVTGLEGGGFVVTSSDAGNLWGQIFDATGAIVVPLFHLSDGVGSTPDVTRLEGGGFVVTWTDHSQAGGDTSGDAVHGKIFDGSGTPVGSELLINTTTEDYQSNPSVTGLDGGGFVVTWTDSSQTGGDASGHAVRGQIFNGNGVPVGDEFLVNATTEGNQNNPSVTGLEGGGFVVTWTDDSQTGGDTSATAIRGQIFDVTPSLTITDVDDTHIESATIAITAGFAQGEDVLAFTDPNGPITGSYDAATGILTLTGSASLADYEAAFQKVTYENTSDNPSTATRTLSFTVNDGDADSNTVTRDITVTPVNDAPMAQGDVFATDEDTALSSNVLADNGGGADGDVDSDALTVIAIAGGQSAAGEPNILISEIMADPSQVSNSTGEWFEAFNASPVAVDVNGWTIRVGTNDIVIDNGGPLPIGSGQFFVFAANGDPAANGGLVADYATGPLGLANTGTTIAILDDSGTEIDSVAYGPGTPGASINLVRSPDGSDTGLDTYVSTLVYGDGDLGTPGSPAQVEPERPRCDFRGGEWCRNDWRTGGLDVRCAGDAQCGRHLRLRPERPIRQSGGRGVDDKLL